MNTVTFGIGFLVGGLLTVSVTQAGNCCPGHRPAAKPAALAQVDLGEDAHPNKESDTAREKKEEIKLQTHCPIMDGNPINRNLYVDHDGKRIYVCCQGCLDPVRNDPAKHIQALEAKGITVAKLQTECPVMGGAINRNLYVDHEGKRIYVCCQGCVAEIRNDPAKYIKSMEKAGVALHTAGQTTTAVQPKKPTAGHEGHRH